MDEATDVARQAHVAASAEQLPPKYSTMCGTGGTQLSGGKKQRVALARALLRKPYELIVDEATSALDSKSEKRVQMALDEVIETSKFTTLIVAHRLSTIQGLGEIIVLENRGDGAEVVQCGTLKELIQNTQGPYYHLFQSQSGDKEGGDGARQQSGAPASSANSADDATTAGVSHTQAVKKQQHRRTMTTCHVSDGGLITAFWCFVPSVRSPMLPRQESVHRDLAAKPAPKLLAASDPSLFQPDVQTLRDKTNFCLSRGPFETLKQTCKDFLACRLSWRLRSMAFENLIYQDMGFFDETANHNGTLVSILSGDVPILTTATMGNFVGLFHALFSVVRGIAIGFHYSWRLALVLLTTFVLATAAEGANHKLGRIYLNAAGGIAKKVGAESASAIFAEAVQGIRVAMSFGLEKHFGALCAGAATVFAVMFDATGFGVAVKYSADAKKARTVQLLLCFHGLHTNSKQLTIDGKPTAEGNHGSIRADLSDIQDVNLTCLRSLIGLVSQEPVLFNLTIGGNIRYSGPDATQAEVEQVVRLANAHGFISGLSQGYGKQAGTAGAQLSGGQRQRIAIARALLRNPKILILDDTTSAVDAESEKQVQATLDEVVAGGIKRSIIIIAHRLSTVRMN
ncbi:hypothetical protein Esti_003416 [Eimeria stiedai]